TSGRLPVLHRSGPKFVAGFYSYRVPWGGCLDNTAPQAGFAIIEHHKLPWSYGTLWFVEADLQSSIGQGFKNTVLVGLAIAYLGPATEGCLRAVAMDPEKCPTAQGRGIEQGVFVTLHHNQHIPFQILVGHIPGGFIMVPQA